ncbi:hypothetical protein M8542_14810 [Amycolatopsis sp. OK19-0408]|uniref:Peptidase inhibitor family I36 n=1 Tax=Amycolatopsis iheyensis TaxID=2945988 RepID=A0A9X2SL29_9PSEU|nr:hypothetical protein [Amycolatopsis iheyensis]MCR6484090.1 hypothetical protein [Amycolatopsis iheyensis]
MRSGSRIGAIVAGAVSLALLGTGAASAGQLGGCDSFGCGVVDNAVNQPVEICLNWGSSTCKPGQASYLAPGHTAGGNGTDIDGYYVPAGRRFAIWNGRPPNQISDVVDAGWHRIHNGTYISVRRVLPA